jgi:nucleoside-diphosphate-sugar epimerase
VDFVMRYVIVDCGPVGLELARRWRAAGHHVLGTTPHPARLPELAAVCAEAVLLDHEDPDRVREVVRHADGVVLATRPLLPFATPVRERVTAYRRSMIGVVRAAASVQRRLVLFSSIAVYGDGATGIGPITEQTPITTALDPAAQCFAAVERTAREAREAVVLRLPEEVVGHPDHVRDLPATVPFRPAALFHTIDYRDLAAVVVHVMALRLTGVFNVVPDTAAPLPAAAYLGELAAKAGLPPPTFTGELAGPVRPVSSATLRATGFRFTHA